MTTIDNRYIELGDIINAFAALPADQVLPIGLHAPHSYRGDYMDLAFEVAYDVTAGEVADMLASCIGQTFDGYKGGYYTMYKSTSCWISEYGTSGGDRIGAVLLHFLTNQTTPEA